MILVHDKFVQKYIQKHPKFLEIIFNTHSYIKYKEKVSKISKELSQFSTATDLVLHLIKNYNFSEIKARDFIHENSKYQYKKENINHKNDRR